MVIEALGVEAVATGAVVVLALVALARELAPPAAIVLGGVVALVLLGVLEAERAFAGLSSPATLSIAGLFVVSRALRQHGRLETLLARLLGDGSAGERGALVRLVPVLAIASGVMNNTPLVATAAPMVRDWAERRGLAASRLLIPVSFAAILGGLLTLIGTGPTLVVSGALGPLMFLRGRYGHGGRVGYDREWRADPKLSGGGELIDQGVHLIDLARWFLGDFPFVDGFAKTYFWDMPVDDNAFLNLRTAQDQTAWLHVSCTEWKNLFSFEIYGRDAKLHIEGLGGSYGMERLHYYKMLPQMGPPETTLFEYPQGDQSWRLEMEAFIEDIRTGRAPTPGLADAAAALHVVQTIYKKNGYA
jgi:hypothetical protein